MGMQVHLHWGRMPQQSGRGRAMRVSADPETQFESLGQLVRLVSFETSRQFGGEIMSPGERRRYRGSWAEQRVVARLATNKTRNATRITTTPPTVSRSQRSELSRASNSRFPVITLVLMSNFTVLTNDCSDQGHKRTLCPFTGTETHRVDKKFPNLTLERRFA